MFITIHYDSVDLEAQKNDGRTERQLFSIKKVRDALKFSCLNAINILVSEFKKILYTLHMKTQQKIAIDRAQRLRKLRAMARLTRKAMTEKHQIPPGTLQNWEMPRFGGLSERGGHQIIQALSIEGVYVSFEWLMMGVGAPPKLSPGTRRYRTQHKLKQKNKLVEEVSHFKSTNSKYIDYLLEDDTMSPKYSAGDVFIGTARTAPREIIALVNRLCIVQLEQGGRVLRYVQTINSAKKTVTFFTQHPNGRCEHKASLCSYSQIWQVIWVRHASALQHESA